MPLKDKVYDHLASDAILPSQLTSFSTQPAIFYRKAPPVDDPGWAGEWYPQIVYTIDTENNQEHKVQGVASFDIKALETDLVQPEEIEYRLMELLDGVVFKETGKPVTSFRWLSSDPFVASDNPQIIGITIYFELLEFPSQTTYTPDAITAIKDWTASNYVEIQVDPETWSAATETNPGIYWRFSDIKSVQMERWGAWITANIVGHVLAPSASKRLQWVRRIAEGLTLKERLTLDDGSPLFIQSVSVGNSLDSLKAGQINSVVKYGLLSSNPNYTKLLNAFIETTDGASGIAR